jgi:multiple sugar transport system permease protein
VELCELKLAGLRPLAAAVVALAFLAPLAFFFFGALRAPGAAPPPSPELLPRDLSLESFDRVFGLIPVERQFLNSLIVVGFAVPLTVLTASWAGFGITLLGPRARRIAVAASLIVLMVPLAALWVPRFLIFREVGLIGSYVPLIAPALMGTTPFFVLLYYWSYRRLPADVVDAARLEGLGPLAIWRRVGMPLVRPTTFAVAALAFVFHWSNFIEPLLYLTDPDTFTLPLGLGSLGVLGPTDLSVLIAGALLVTIPALIAFALVQRRFLQNTRLAGWLGR